MFVHPFKIILSQKYTLIDWLEFSLIILSSVLLGIWAAANTIALRNILLVLGTLLSIAYFYQLYCKNQLKQYFGLRSSIPLFCIIGLFLWVLAHCFLFPTDYATQINELKSTWLRSALAAVVGVATGIAIVRNPSKIYWLWIGMILCFVYLLGQYLVDVWHMHKLFTERYMQYIFLGKVNGVLVGSILISGILGTSLSPTYEQSKHKISLGVIGILAIALVLFSYLYILEARNGFLISVILIVYWSIFQFKKTLKKNKSAKSLFKNLLPISLVVLLILFALIKHIERVPQWVNLIEDISISSQIDKYSTWQYPDDMGPPKGANDRVITANTYLRVAWITAGIKLIPQNLLGHGVLHESFQRALDDSIYMGAKVKSTHSMLLDFYFSFGLIGFTLIAFAFSMIFFAAHKGSLFNIAIKLIIINCILLYFLTENTRQHSIEILIFIISFLNSMGSNEVNSNFRLGNTLVKS